MHPYREASSTELVVSPARARRLPAIRIGMLAGGALVGLATVAFSPAIATIGGVVALLGFYGILGYSWADAHRRIDELAALPFPVLHDRPDAVAFDTMSKIASLSIETRAPVEVTPPFRPTRMRELAELLTTWGIAVHERYGIVEVRVKWARRSGPPPAL